MPDPEMTPEQLRRVRDAKAALEDPVVQRRIRQGREALAQDPAVVRAAGLIVDAVSPVVRLWGEGINRWLRSAQIDVDRIRATMRVVGEAFRRLIPTNAGALDVESWPTLQRLGAEEQLCLSWVPNESLARALCEAQGPAARNELLLESAPSVLASCQAALDEVAAVLDEVQVGEDPWPVQLIDVVELVESCVRSASDGHWAAAQALATCASDSLLTQHIADRKGHSFVKAKLKLVEEEQFAAVLLGPVLAAVESSMRQPASWNGRGRASYSRNATVHAASVEVFSEVNSLKSIILATSLLKASVSPLLWFLVDLVPGEPSSREE